MIVADDAQAHRASPCARCGSSRARRAYFGSHRLHARAATGRVPAAACAAGAPGREPGLRRHVRQHRLEAVRARADPPQLGRAAAGARRRPLRVGRLPRPRRCCRSSATRSAAGSRRPTPRTCRADYPYRRAQDRLRVGGAVPAAPHPGGAAPAARRVGGGLPAPAGRPPLGAGRAHRPAAGGPRAAEPPHRAGDPPAAPLGPRAVAGLRRRGAVRGLELDRAADRGAARRARLPEGGRRDLARRPDRDPRAARATGRPPRPPPAARPRSRAADEPRARDRPHRGAARHALVALGVGQAARRPLRAPDRARGRRGARRRLSVGPVPVGGGGETVGDTGYATDGPPKGGRGRGRSSRSPPAPRSAR